MYWVSGWLSMGPLSTCSSVSGMRRQAFSFSDPLRNAFTAALAKVDDVMPCSCM